MRAADATDLAAWSEAQVAALFSGLESAPALLLAVSGGPDSMALLRLATRWIAAFSGPRLHVATVDHGLRAEAGAEAAFVASECAERGQPHATLVWRGPKPVTGIQERARAARYCLLAEHARSVGATHILTAHHADDQAETVLMRLGRGSGLDGLAGIRRVHPLASDVILVRPLLDLPKSALVAFCRSRQQLFVSDRSNGDPAYARVRLRKQAADAARLGLERPTLLRLARRMARAEEALELETTRIEALLMPDRRPGLWRAALAPIRSTSPEIFGRVLRRALVAFNPTEPRLARLEKLTDMLHDALQAERTYGGTLGGTQVILAADSILTITLEKQRRRGRAKQLVSIDDERPAEMTR